MVDGRQIVIDTGCFFETGAALAVIAGLVPELQASNGRLFVLDSSVREIEDGLRAVDGLTSAKYQQAAKILEALDEADVWLRVNGPQSRVSSGTENTATLIIDLVITFQLTHTFCVVTQNERLARLLLQNSNSPAIKGVKGVSVAYIEDGKFHHWIPRLMRRDGLVNAESELEKRIAKTYRIIVDTCSLMLPSSDLEAAGLEFLARKLVPELQKHEAKMIVSQRVLHELGKHAKRAEIQQVIAVKVLSFLNSPEAEQAVVVARDDFELSSPDPNFADPVIVRAIRFQAQHNICFITQDRNLAELLLRNHEPSSGKDYQVLFINHDGRFLWNWERKIANQDRRLASRAMERTT